MTNAELIKALRYCSDNEKEEGCDECPYLYNGMCSTMLSDAAYALEAADKRIAELEAQLPKEGEWVDAFVGELPVQVCSKCNTFFPLAYTGGGHHYCPNCGARMKGEQE